MLRLVVGPLNYSSWSMRPWLALHHAGADFRAHEIALFVDPGWRDKVLAFSGAGKVPVLIDGSLSVHESLAICETVAERFPDAGLWPADPALRARARAVSAEMASSFDAVRGEMPTNWRARARGFVPSAACSQQVDRVFEIWESALSTTPGDFLFGDFGIADCMYVPVLSRFRTYGIPLRGKGARWAERIWAQPSVVRLAELAEQSVAIPRYDELIERGA